MSYLSLIPMHCMIFYPYLVFGKPRGVCLTHVENGWARKQEFVDSVP